MTYRLRLIFGVWNLLFYDGKDFAYGKYFSNIEDAQLFAEKSGIRDGDKG